jgi:rhamnogalacturonyl hydrolase YesR
MWDDDAGKYIRAAHWGTGNGWALAGMARMLRLLPVKEYQEDIKKIQSMTIGLLDSVLKYMRTDGLFHDVIDDSSTFTETNLTQMAAYTIYDGINQGWLAASYSEKARILREAAVNKTDDCGFVHDVCGAPTFDKPGFSPEGQAFALLMENAYVGRTPRASRRSRASARRRPSASCSS